jgi:signal transduction histidine kinase
MALSTRLLGREAAELGATIQEALGDIASVVGADRAYVLKLNLEGRSVGDAFEEWWADGVDRRTTPIAELPRAAQRHWLGSLSTGVAAAVDDVDALAAEAPEAAEALRADGVRSILFVPLLAQQAPVGFIGLEGRRRRIAWTESLVSRMRVVGEIVVTAVERCQGEVERNAIAEALAARNEELERSNRELQQFASVVSHDLLQPLAVVQGFVAQLLRIALEHPEKADLARSCGDAATRAVARMRQLMDDVLAVARAGAPLTEFEPVDLQELLAETVDDLGADIEAAGATVEVDAPLTIQGGRTQLHQLFQNLVANAVKFRSPDRPPVVRVTARAAGDRCVVTVADNGIGIPPDARERVFEMFARSGDAVAAGSGIGLAICARVVAAHGGTITIGDGVDGGCEVAIDLPLRQ